MGWAAGVWAVGLWGVGERGLGHKEVTTTTKTETVQVRLTWKVFSFFVGKKENLRDLDQCVGGGEGILQKL